MAWAAEAVAVAVAVAAVGPVVVALVLAGGTQGRRGSADTPRQ